MRSLIKIIRLPAKESRRLASTLLVLLSAASCTPNSTEGVTQWPEGTVVAIDGIPITAAKVDSYIEDIGKIEPAFSKAHRRRDALVNIVLPLTYSQMQGGEKREAMRAMAESWNTERKSGLMQGPPEEPLQGTWDMIGLEVWLVASKLEPGEWSEVFEIIGGYAVVQLIARDGATHAGLELFEIQLKTFPYVRDPEYARYQYMEAKLEIIDPEWNEIVPGFWKYKMRGDS